MPAPRGLGNRPGPPFGDVQAPKPWTIWQNIAEGGTPGVTVSTGNSGGASLRAWDTVSIGANTTVTFDTDEIMHDNVAYKFTLGTPTAACSLQWTTLPLSNVVFFRFYFFYQALPNGTACLARLTDPTGATQIGRIQLTTAGKLQVADTTSSQVALSTNVLPANQWIRIEAYFLANATTGVGEAKYWNNPDSLGLPDEIITAPGINTSALTIGQLRFGIAATTTVTNITLWYDDFAASPDGYVGPSQYGGAAGPGPYFYSASGDGGWYTARFDEDQPELASFWLTNEDSQTLDSTTAVLNPPPVADDSYVAAASLEEAYQWDSGQSDEYWANVYGFPDPALEVLPALFPPDVTDDFHARQLDTSVGQDIGLLFPDPDPANDQPYVEQNEGYLSPNDPFDVTIATQPHYGEYLWSDQDTEDYANDSTLDTSWSMDFASGAEVTIATEPLAEFGAEFYTPDETQDYAQDSTLDVAPAFATPPPEPIETFAAQPHFGEWTWEDEPTQDYASRSVLETAAQRFPPCVNVVGGANIQTAINANPAGTAFCISGVHDNNTDTLPLLPKVGNQFLGDGTAVIDGLNVATRLMDGNNVDNVRIDNITFKNCNNGIGDCAVGRQNVGYGWQVTNCDIGFNASEGLRVGPGAYVTNNKVHDNGQLGIAGFQCDGAQVLNNEVYNNNLASAFNVGNEAGGIKFFSASHACKVTVNGNFVHDNIGPGIWMDTDIGGGEIAYNTVTRCAGQSGQGGHGLEIELCCGLNIHHNLITDCDQTQIMNSTSNNITYDHNTLAGGGDGILIWHDSTRTGATLCGISSDNNTVTNNTITQGVKTGAQSGGTGHTGVYVFNGTLPAGTVFESNHYLGKCDAATTYWIYDVTPTAKTFAQWQALGFDNAGDCNTATEVFATQPHYGALPLDEVLTEDYAADASLDVTALFIAAALDDGYVAAQDLPDQTDFTPDDYTNAQPLVDGAVEALQSPNDAFDVTIAAADVQPDQAQPEEPWHPYESLSDGTAEFLSLVGDDGYIAAQDLSDQSYPVEDAWTPDVTDDGAVAAFQAGDDGRYAAQDLPDQTYWPADETENYVSQSALDSLPAVLFPPTPPSGGPYPILKEGLHDTTIELEGVHGPISKRGLHDTTIELEGLHDSTIRKRGMRAPTLPLP